MLRTCGDDQNNKQRETPMSPQARGSAGGRRRHDPASQEDHDKPYVCDSKYRRRRLPSPAPALTPVPTIPVLPCLAAPSPRLAGSSSGARTLAPMPAPPLSHHLLSALMFLHEESTWEALGAVFLSLAVPFLVAFLCLCVCHSVSLRSPISFSTSENYKQKHNSESSNKSTWFLWLFICFPFLFFFSSSCPT